MSVTRRFLIVPSLGRLIRKERGGSRITEGYFAPQGGRTSLVRVDGQQCHLVLISSGAGGVSSEERTEVPRAHGDALMDVCNGKAVYERTTLTLAPNREAVIDRYVQPAGIDLVSVAFENEQAAQGFRAPVWCGPEVTANNGYDRHAIALNGPPEPARLALSNAMLDALLDLLEPRFGLGRYGNNAPAPGPAPTPPPARPPEPVASAPAVPSAPEPARRPNPAPAPAARAPAPEPKPATPLPAPPAEVLALAAEAPAEAHPAPVRPAEAATDNSKPDARIDDVIESLSQALGAAIQQPSEGGRSDDLAGSFERWQVKPRRTQT